ncbi:MAG: hypothetical protein DMF64_17985 [Acidobacteria bacterium]|nr:MAG: hypothetical protein DMF64_17985 [Acidobacteriota bacterium]
MPPNSIELDVLIGFVEYRTVSKSGIELFTLLYNNAALSLIRRALKPGERVKVKYDPNDISVIYVWDKTNIRFIPVPALDQDYTRRLTLWQHNVIKKYAQRFVRGQLDMDALYRAKEQIQLIIARERQLKRRISRSEKLARYLNIAQPIFGKEDGDAHDSFMRASEYASLADDSQPQLIGEHLLTSTDFTAESSNNGNSRTDSAKNAKAACHADSVADEAVDNDQIQPDGGWNASYKLPPGREYENEQA